MVWTERTFGPQLARIVSIKASRSGTISDLFFISIKRPVKFRQTFLQRKFVKSLNLLNGKFLNKKPRDVLCKTKLQGLASYNYTVVIIVAMMASDVAKVSLKPKLRENISPKFQYENMRAHSFAFSRNKNGLVK
jgi:hypothetical protein